jgi:hypothetical protein
MKTSNKILLGLFIAALLLITGIHVALTQRYKNGRFVVTRSGQNRDSIVIKPVKYVNLSGLENVIVLPSASYRLEVQKNMPSTFRYHVSGDTLVVTGNAGASSTGDEDNRIRIYEEVRLYLPLASTIRAENTNLSISGNLDSAQGTSTRIELIQSRLSFRNRFNENEDALYFGDVFVNAKQHSEVELSSDNIHFDTLSFDLEKSVFRDNETGNIKNFIVKADDSSVVQVTGLNFKKLTAATTAQ